MEEFKRGNKKLDEANAWSEDEVNVSHSLVGITEHLTESLKYFCLGVCGTPPWLSYVRSDDEAVSVTVEMSYIGECDWQWHVCLWVYKAVVLVHIQVISGAHTGRTFLYKASAASGSISRTHTQARTHARTSMQACMLTHANTHPCARKHAWSIDQVIEDSTTCSIQRVSEASKDAKWLQPWNILFHTEQSLRIFCWHLIDCFDCARSASKVWGLPTLGEMFLYHYSRFSI